MSACLRAFFAAAPKLGVLALVGFAACTEPTTTTAVALDSSSDTVLGDALTGDAPVTDTLAGDGVTGDTATDTAKDTAVGDTSGPKYGTCAAVGDCIAVSCKSGEKGCESACLAASDSAAIAKALPVLSCYNDKCVADLCKDSTDTTCNDGCMKTRCMPELFACIDNGTPGTKGCGSMPACMDTCKLGGATPFSCLAACYADIDAAGRVLGNAVAQCMAKADPKTAEEQCTGALLQCFSGGKTGTQECFEGFACVTACQKTGGSDLDGIACAAGCLAKVTKAGQDAFLSLMPCFGQDKLSAECSAKFLGCANPTGTGDCYGGLACIETCQKGTAGSDGPQCLFECAHAMTPSAATDFMATANCLGNQAAQAECAPTFLKCVAPTGSKACVDVVACLKQCPENSGTCMFTCLKSGSAASSEQAWKMALCGQTCATKCGAGGDACTMQCMGTTCPAELAACTVAN